MKQDALVPDELTPDMTLMLIPAATSLQKACATYLQKVRMLMEDMTRATIRFGQYAFNQYRKTYGRPPYTRRINGNGPVKVYLDPIEYIFLSHTYNQGRRRHQGKEHA